MHLNYRNLLIRKQKRIFLAMKFIAFAFTSMYFICSTFVSKLKAIHLKRKFFIVFIFFIGFASYTAFGQIDRGGAPRSFSLPDYQKTKLKSIEILAPDLKVLSDEDIENVRLEKAYRIGVEIPVSFSSLTDGDWIETNDGGRLWRLSLKSGNAKAIGLNYNTIRLPQGCDMFVYTPDHTFIIGAFTNNELGYGSIFATRPIAGGEVIIEVYEPKASRNKSVVEISGISYVYRGFNYNTSFNSAKSISDSCEVNINCEEGVNWQTQKRGVVKLYTKVNSNYYWCTGTIMNNTKQDFSGLLLTASHCSKDYSGSFSSDNDLLQWIFYFNYESPGCITSGGQEYTVVGAQRLAVSTSSDELGSDFLLLKLASQIPASYNPYFCGWDIESQSSNSGVGIHHPNGEVKKISTYTTPIAYGTWGSIPNTHWIVKWAATPNGHGVTEGGSSGSPLFNEEKLLIGTLTGGASGCSDLTGEDMYGKVSYSWISNGLTADRQLKPWLDPENTGRLWIHGAFNEKFAVADFSANSVIIPVGGTVNFYDDSHGNPEFWHWYFESGDPSESTEQNPSGIRFERFGLMNVKLVVSNSVNSDSIVKENYIDVRSVVSPNPGNGEITILSDMNNESNMTIEVYDMYGKIAQQFEYTGASSSHKILLPENGNLFFVKVIQGDQVQTHKVIVVH